MCPDLKTAPDWSSIPSHRPRSLPKARGRRHMGANTIQWVAERGLFSDHTLSTTAVLLFLLTLTRRIFLLRLKLTFKCFSVKLTSCRKFGLESQCICYDVRSKCSECSWESQAEPTASLISHQDGHERWYISNSKQVELFPLMWLPCIMKYCLSLSHEAVVWKASGVKAWSFAIVPSGLYLL